MYYVPTVCQALDCLFSYSLQIESKLLHQNNISIFISQKMESVWTVTSPSGSSLWNSPGENTGMDCHFLLQGIFPIQGSDPVSCIVGRFFTLWATGETPKVSRKYLKVCTGVKWTLEVEWENPIWSPISAIYAVYNLGQLSHLGFNFLICEMRLYQRIF